MLNYNNYYRIFVFVFSRDFLGFVACNTKSVNLISFPIKIDALSANRNQVYRMDDASLPTDDGIYPKSKGILDEK